MGERRTQMHNKMRTKPLTIHLGRCIRHENEATKKGTEPTPRHVIHSSRWMPATGEKYIVSAE